MIDSNMQKPLILGCIQPSYIPWRGYFHIIQRSDIFVFHDDIQYTKQDWRNRNRIKTPNGSQWLTVPVRHDTISGDIKDVIIDNSSPWAIKHLHLIELSYHKSPYYYRYRDFFHDVYNKRWENLADLDIYLVEQICYFLRINTKLIRSSELGITGKKTDRLVQICKILGANLYISGPAAKAYIEMEKFDSIGVCVEYQTYEYPNYPQLHGAFDPFLSVIDLLFNCEDDSPRYIFDL